MKFIDYIKGFRKGKGANSIEKEAMYDPFLEDAIDGYDSVKGNHTDTIFKLQKQISKKTKPQTSRHIWLSVASVASVVFVVAYFTLFNKQQNSLLDNDSLFVYVPEDYVRKAQMTDELISPSVEIKNMDLFEPMERIEVYIPEDYLERKKAENKETKTTTTIVNLKEMLAPDKAIEIYIPEEYLNKKNKSREPRVVIENSIIE